VASGIRAAVFVAIPATAGMLLIGPFLVAAIFEQGKFTSDDSSKVAWTLSFYVTGLCGYFMQQIITRAYFSMKDSKTPFYSALIAVSVNLVLNLTLIWYLRTGGLALSTALCSYLQVVIMVSGLYRRLGRSVVCGLVLTAVKTLAAACVMTLCALGLRSMLTDLPYTRLFNMLRVGILVFGGGSVFIIAAWALGIEELKLLSGRKYSV